MKVAVIGGTGFVGSYLVDELVERGHEPALLVRPGSESNVVQRQRCRLTPGDVRDPAAVRATLQDCEAAIYNIGLLREHKSQGLTFEEMQFQGAARSIDLAIELGVRRFILMSANGVKADGTTYQTTKYRAEQHLKTTALDWTIFRPSVIFGEPRGAMEFCTQLRDQLIDSPLPAPLFYQGLLPTNAGAFKLAPIHIKDVATIFIQSLTMPATFGQTYGLCGPDPFDWKTLIATIAGVCGKHKLALPVPAWAVQTAAAFLEDYEFFPISRGQIAMLLEGNTCDSTAVFEQFGVTPIRFNEQSLAYLRQK